MDGCDVDAKAEVETDAMKIEANQEQDGPISREELGQARTWLWHFTRRVRARLDQDREKAGNGKDDAAKEKQKHDSTSSES